MDAGVFEEVAKQLKDNPQLASMLVEEQKKMEAQASINDCLDFKINIACYRQHTVLLLWLNSYFFICWAPTSSSILQCITIKWCKFYAK